MRSHRPRQRHSDTEATLLFLGSRPLLPGIPERKALSHGTGRGPRWNPGRESRCWEESEPRLVRKSLGPRLLAVSYSHSLILLFRPAWCTHLLKRIAYLTR